jgi:hypothetical protein
VTVNLPTEKTVPEVMIRAPCSTNECLHEADDPFEMLTFSKTVDHVMPCVTGFRKHRSLETKGIKRLLKLVEKGDVMSVDIPFMPKCDCQKLLSRPTIIIVPYSSILQLCPCEPPGLGLDPVGIRTDELREDD